MFSILRYIRVICLTNRAKPLAFITKPHGHKTGKNPKIYIQTGPKVTSHYGNTILSSQDTEDFFF